jgi:hypothetical protein
VTTSHTDTWKTGAITTPQQNGNEKWGGGATKSCYSENSKKALTFRNRASYNRTATLRYHSDVAFYIYFFNKYKY